MEVGVTSDQVPSIGDAARPLRVRLGPTSLKEERGPYAEILERVQQTVAGVRGTVRLVGVLCVEGESYPHVGPSSGNSSEPDCPPWFRRQRVWRAGPNERAMRIGVEPGCDASGDARELQTSRRVAACEPASPARHAASRSDDIVTTPAGAKHRPPYLRRTRATAPAPDPEPPRTGCCVARGCGLRPWVPQSVTAADRARRRNGRRMAEDHGGLTEAIRHQPKAKKQVGPPFGRSTPGQHRVATLSGVQADSSLPPERVLPGSSISKATRH